MGKTIKEAVKEFNREHPQGFFGKLMKSTRENAEGRARERAELRRAEQEIYHREFMRARLKRAANEGRQAGGHRWTDSLSSFIGSSSGGKGKKKRKDVKFDMFDNWGFMK